MGRSKVWLLAFGMVYMLSCCILLFVYEKRFQRFVAVTMSLQQAFERPPRRKSTAARSLGTSLLPHSARVHTCTLRNGTIQLPMAPDVILAGAMKSGTSYFWNLLRMHPDFVPSRKFEAHFFDWQFAVPPRDLDSDKFWTRFDGDATVREHQVCAARKKYIDENFDTDYLLKSKHTRMTYEKTPNYMFLPQIPKLISQICPWMPKIILILRNPVDRAYSHYVMDSEKDSVNLSFEQYIQLELETMRQHGLTNVPNVSTSVWATLNESRHGRHFRISRNNMTRKQHDHADWMVYRERHMRNYLQRGIYSVQLERWKEYFPLNQSLIVIDNDRLHKEPRQVMEEVLTFLGAPRPHFFADESVSMKTKDSVKRKGSRVMGIASLLSIGGYPPMANSTRRFLEMFFKPYNHQMVDVLGREWEGIWD
jgi:Sulfotransferase domain